MNKLLPPKLRFGLYVQDLRTNQGKITTNQYVMCYADSYEVSSGGAITFFQILSNDEGKKYKIPVLSYPEGRWEACVLLDEHNEFPVFKGFSTVSSHGKNNEDHSNNEETHEEKSTHRGSGHNSSYQANLNHPSQHSGSNLPGVNNMLNPQDFKKQKEEWIENEIKTYSKENDNFDLNHFMSIISKQQQSRTFKPIESDIEWAVSKLIRNKAVMARKFAEQSIQQNLSLILPDIMKRHWDGKMSPILEILQEREETKNVTAIDLAVWMSRNNY